MARLKTARDTHELSQQNGGVVQVMRLERGDRVLFVGGYWNSGRDSFAVVASLTPNVDWAAYIGGVRGRLFTETAQDVVDWGAKLSEGDARKWFDGIPELEAAPLGYRC